MVLGKVLILKHYNISDNTTVELDLIKYEIGMVRLTGRRNNLPISYQNMLVKIVIINVN